MAGRNLRVVLASLALVVVLPSSAAASTGSGDVIVKFEAGASASAREAGRDAVGGDVEATIRPGTQVLEVDGSARAAVAALERRGAVAWAEPVRPTRAVATANDPLMWTQWGLRNTAQYAGGVAGADINVEPAWDISRGTGVLLGIVDTGVRFDHPDLGGFWWNPGEISGNGRDDDHNGRIDDMRGWDFTNGDANPTDDHMHGTAVTSVAAARTDNLVGMAGVAGGATIMETKALGANGSGDTAQLAAAMDYLGTQGARVVNLSIAAGYSQAVTDAVAAHPDTLYVAAAGNYNRDNEVAPVFPCSLPHENVLCVGATGHEDARASFSNWGSTTVDLMVPGVSITAASMATGGYMSINGTSFSAPLTSGVATLLFSHRPQATPAMVKAAILAGVDPVAAFAGITVTGGRLDARGALDALTTSMSAAPGATVAPAISGTARLEQTLTAADGTWAGSADTYRRQWLRCTTTGAACAEIAGARGTTFAPGAREVGHTVRVRVVAAGADGSAQALSGATAVVGADRPAATAVPAITGTTTFGARLTATQGTWSGAPTFANQWLTCNAAGTGCTPIAGATSLGFTLGLAQIGQTLRLRVTATGPGGVTTVDTAPTAVIAGTAPAATVAPTVTGIARLGSVLTGQLGTWSGAPAPTLARQWLRCDSAGASCVAIAGGTGATYALAAADLGARLRLRATAVNAYGTRIVDSAATAAVTALPPAATVLPTITGTPRQTLVLRGGDGTWQGLPAPTRTRAWLRCDAAGAACAAIAGATDAVYTLTADDLGRTIRFRVIAANAGGSVEARSAATTAVLVPPVAPVATAVPLVSGTVQVTRTLTGTAGTWTGDPAPTLARAWLRCDAAGNACAAIAGAAGATYVATSADVGRTLRHRVTGTNVGGTQTATSAATVVVLPLPPVLLSAPAISYPAGAAVLTVSTGLWSNAPTSYRYQWYRCDAVGAACTAIWGATASTLVPTVAETGHALRVRVTAVNAAGDSLTTTTGASRVVTA